MLNRAKRTQRAAGLAPSPALFESLEERTVFDSVPIVDGFYRPGGPQTQGTSPRLPGTVTYVDGVPTYSITYAQMKAALVASDPDNDTPFFLYRGGPNGGYRDVNGNFIVSDNAAFGLVDSQGNIIPLTINSDLGPGSQYDTNSDGVLDGPLVLEPGETWTWRGFKYQPFTGKNSVANEFEAIAPDAALWISVMDRIRDWSTVQEGFGLISGNLTPVIDGTALNNRPNPLPAPWIIDVGHNNTATWTYEQLRAAVPVSDPENDQIYFLLTPTAGFEKTGLLKINGTDVNTIPRDPQNGNIYPAPDQNLASDALLLIGPGDTITFEPTGLAGTTLFSLGVWDRIGGSDRQGILTFATRTTANQAPTALAAVDLGQLDLTKHKTFTGAEIIALMQLSDGDNDALELRIDQRFDAGSVLINGKPASLFPTFKASDTLEFVSPGFVTGQTGFVVRARDAYSAAGVYTDSALTFSTAAFAFDQAAGSTKVASNGQVSSGTTAFISAAVWRSPDGHAIISFEFLSTASSTTPNFQRVDLTAKFGLANATDDPIVATDDLDVVVMVPTSEGLIGIRLAKNDQGEAHWTIKNFSALVPKAPITGLITTPQNHGLGLVIGRNADGDLVALAALGPTYDPVVVNINQELAATSQTLPAFVGSLTAYETDWTALTIAGVDASGNLWSVWTPAFIFRGPGDDGYYSFDDAWGVNNLSQITGVASISSGLSVYLTSWQGINIAGLNAVGELIVTWWVPSFGGQWHVNNFTQEFGGPALQAGSITAYTTEWSALNIIGVDAEGQAHAYWWEPTRAANPATDRWSVDPLGPAGFDPTNRLSAGTTSLLNTQVQLTRITIFGVNTTDDAYAIYWTPSLGGTWSVLSV